MQYEEKSKQQLIAELAALEDRVAQLEILQVEHQRVEEALRKSEKRYRDLFENANDIIYSHDLAGNLTSSNKKAQELMGYTYDEAVKTNIAQLMEPEQLALIQERIKHRIAGETPPALELDIVSKNGVPLSLETNSWLEWEDGKPVAVHGIARDITERKQAERAIKELNENLERRVIERTAYLEAAKEALAAEKERLAVTLGSIGDGVIATDAEGRIGLINQVTEKLTGWSQEQAIGKMVCEVFHVIDEQTREKCEDIVAKVLETGLVVVLSNNRVLIDKNGRERVIFDSGAPIRDKAGKVIGMVVVFRDITEKRRLEQEMQKASKLESVGVLAGGIAHDFNNLLQAIIGNLSLAMMSTDPLDNLYQRLLEIKKATLTAKNLTHQLLTFAIGGIPIVKTVAIAELLKETAIFALRGSNIQCEFSIADDLWLVDIDEGQINQVISNLVINAQQAMPAGGRIEIAAANISADPVQDLPLLTAKYIKISVKDQGTGIPKDHLQKIFDPYFTTKEKGSGLGLATSYSIIKKHAGHIKVESKVGVGTVLHLYLPASKIAVRPKNIAQKRFLSGEGRILVMDDQQIIRELAQEMLSRCGYEVMLAEEGAQAVALYRLAKKSGQPFDIVILDLTVPGGMGGKETIKTLLEIDPEVKAIVSSGYSSDPIMADFKQYGFKGVIAKPYRVEELIEILQNSVT